jgi:hypothetical protein
MIYTTRDVAQYLQYVLLPLGALLLMVGIKYYRRFAVERAAALLELEGEDPDGVSAQLSFSGPRGSSFAPPMGDHIVEHASLPANSLHQPCDDCCSGECHGGCDSRPVLLAPDTVVLANELAVLRTRYTGLEHINRQQAAGLGAKYTEYEAAVHADKLAATLAAATLAAAAGGRHPHQERSQAVLAPVGDMLDGAFDPREWQPVLFFDCPTGQGVTFTCLHAERPLDDNVEVLEWAGHHPRTRRPRTFSNLSINHKELAAKHSTAAYKEVCGEHESSELGFVVLTPLASAVRVAADHPADLALAPLLSQAEHRRGMAYLANNGEYHVGTLILCKGGVWTAGNGAQILAPSTHACRVLQMTCEQRLGCLPACPPPNTCPALL